MKEFRRSSLISSQNHSVVLHNMNDTGFRAVIVEDRMVGLVTNRDVRKSLLKGISLTTPLTSVIALQIIPINVHDLINSLTHADCPVGTFPISEFWEHEDYERENRNFHQYLSIEGIA